jgi:hypothetical protein
MRVEKETAVVGDEEARGEISEHILKKSAL